MHRRALKTTQTREIGPCLRIFMVTQCNLRINDKTVETRSVRCMTTLPLPGLRSLHRFQFSWSIYVRMWMYGRHINQFSCMDLKKIVIHVRAKMNNGHGPAFRLRARHAHVRKFLGFNLEKKSEWLNKNHFPWPNISALKKSRRNKTGPRFRWLGCPFVLHWYLRYSYHYYLN